MDNSFITCNNRRHLRAAVYLILLVFSYSFSLKQVFRAVNSEVSVIIFILQWEESKHKVVQQVDYSHMANKGHGSGLRTLQHGLQSLVFHTILISPWMPNHAVSFQLGSGCHGTSNGTENLWQFTMDGNPVDESWCQEKSLKDATVAEPSAGCLPYGSEVSSTG